MPEIENKKPPPSPNVMFGIANSFEDLDTRRRLIGKRHGFIPYHTGTAPKLTEVLNHDREEEIIGIVIDKSHARLLRALADVGWLRLVGNS